MGIEFVLVSGIVCGGTIMTLAHDTQHFALDWFVKLQDGHFNWVSLLTFVEEEWII